MGRKHNDIDFMMDSEEFARCSRMDTIQTVENREQYLIDLAYRAAEFQLRNGSASASTINQLLKLGTVRAEIELQKLRTDNDLTLAKTRATEASANKDDELAAVISAMNKYKGSADAVDEIDDIEEDDYGY